MRNDVIFPLRHQHIANRGDVDYSLVPSDAIWRHRSVSLPAEAAKPLPETILTYHQ